MQLVATLLNDSNGCCYQTAAIDHTHQTSRCKSCSECIIKISLGNSRNLMSYGGNARNVKLVIICKRNRSVTRCPATHSHIRRNNAYVVRCVVALDGALNTSVKVNVKLLVQSAQKPGR
jgi:hypothetical protein